ncbi:ABC transporter substrate-binding protein [Chlorogloeopsis sp. ULAP02]
MRNSLKLRLWCFARWLNLFLLMIITLTLTCACYGKFSQPSSNFSSLIASECRIVKHSMGESCVPINPQRIIVLDTSPLDAVLTLGLKPIGATEFDDLKQINVYPKEQTEGIAVIGGDLQPNLEKIALLKPDLILSPQFYVKKIYNQLSQIAPTVVAASGNAAESNSWKDYWKEDLKIYADALNKTQEAEQLLHNYHQRIAEFHKRMGDRLNETEVSIIATINYGPNYPTRIYLRGSFMGSVIEEAGLKRPVAQIKDGFTADVSIERLDLIEGDVMFVVTPKPEESTLTQLKQNPLWFRLNVVKQSKVYNVHYATWVAQRNIGGANRILDDLFRYLVKENYR